MCEQIDNAWTRLRKAAHAPHLTGLALIHEAARQLEQQENFAGDDTHEESKD